MYLDVSFVVEGSLFAQMYRYMKRGGGGCATTCRAGIMALKGIVAQNNQPACAVAEGAGLELID